MPAIIPSRLLVSSTPFKKAVISLKGILAKDKE